MFEVWNTVKVKNPDLARDGQAGVVSSLDPADKTMVEVDFDVDRVREWFPVASLTLLKSN